MGITVKDEIMEFKRQREVKYYIRFSDGSDTAILRKSASDVDDINTQSVVGSLCYYLKDVGEYLVYSNKQFDTLKTPLKIGLLYDKDINMDIDIKNSNANPVMGVAYLSSAETKGYCNDKQVSEDGIVRYPASGFIKYDEFLALLEEKGISFNGPQSFEEFIGAMTFGIPFNMELAVNMREEEKVLKRSK